MKVRARLREHTVVGIIALFFIFGLICVDLIWPDGFTVFIAIGGTLGALMVLYEVRLTKQIAQAEFIRDLQSSFASDQNIVELWRKLQLDEEITAADRPLMSSYLTFFETVYLLQDRGALDLSLTDDLFRNRFFTAVGHPVIVRETLMKTVGAFTNIHALIALWYDHLLQKKKPIPPGYYSYLLAVLEARGFQLIDLEESRIDDLMNLQRTVLDGLGENNWLRENTREMLLECLTREAGTPGVRATEAHHAHRSVADADGPVAVGSGVASSEPDAASPVRRHRAIGVVKGDALVAAGILYDGGVGEESIKHYFTSDEAAMRETINLKLILADPAYRRHRLGATIVKLLEHEAATARRKEILCTIHPKNVPSMRLFSSLGYRRIGKARTQYGERVVFSRNITTIDAHSIR